MQLQDTVDKENELSDALHEAGALDDSEDETTVAAGSGSDSQTIQVATLAEHEGDVEKTVNANQDKLRSVDGQVILDAMEEMQAIDDSRGDLNSQASEIRARLKNLGIPAVAFNAAYGRYKQEPRKRAETDAGFAKCCDVMGVGYQSGLFDSATTH
jgi:hypothetical protein